MDTERAALEELRDGIIEHEAYQDIALMVPALNELHQSTRGFEPD